MNKTFTLKKIKGIQLFSLRILGIRYTMSKMELEALRDFLIIRILKLK